MLYKRFPLFIIIIAGLLASCIEDGFTTSPSDQPRFSVDTLDMGVVFTAEQTATHRFVVYNPYSKSLNLSQVAMTGENARYFRVNVDGMAGTTFTDIEIRANDSIYVFVSADLPENTSSDATIKADLSFTVNGQVSKVVVTATGQDITRLQGEVITDDTEFTATRPYQIKDSLVVEQGATLTLAPGTTLLFHDDATLVVRGTVRTLGTADSKVRLTGDRMGNVITDVSFDLMSRQWAGVEILAESKDNYMTFTEISNTSYGVVLYGDGVNVDEPKLTLVNCRLHNSGENVLTSIGASIDASGCEFAEASYSLVYLVGGSHRFDLCTAANNYLFSAVTGAAWMFIDPAEASLPAEMLPVKALITNSITYGLGADVSPGDLTGREIYFKRCLFKAQGTDDENFIDSLWDADPLFYTVRADYIFDYRLKPESPAISAAYPALSDSRPSTDYYGVPRADDLGAYTYVAPKEQ